LNTATVAVSVTHPASLGYELLLELAAAHYPTGSNARRLDYLRWLYEQNPHGDGKIAAAIEGGLLLAMMALIPLKIRAGTSLIRANMVFNVLTHPAHRGKNLFVKLIRAAQQHCERAGEWLIGHPNALAIPGWKRTKMSFQSGYELRWMAPTMGFGNGRERRVRTRSELHSLNFQPLADWRMRLGHPVIEADANYLAWRFFDHPSREYHVTAQVDGSQISAYAVRRQMFLPMALTVDWQGAEYWQNGPPAPASRICVLAWPENSKQASQPTPTRVRSFRWKRKHYPFFATPPSGLSPYSLSWAAVTLAATDFA
jgi:hypothetical protein